MHRSQEILSTITTLLTGLSFTGSNVLQTRYYPTQNLPALTIQREADTVQDFLSNSFVDRYLELSVSIHVAGDPTKLDESASDIAAEVYTAILANPNLGLSYVIDAIPLGDSSPEISGESETPTMLLQQQWRIHYRHSYQNPEL